MPSSLLDAISTGQQIRRQRQQLEAGQFALDTARRREELRPLEGRLASMALGNAPPPRGPNAKPMPDSPQGALAELVALNPELGQQVQQAGLKIANDAETRAANQQKVLGAFMQSLASVPEDQRAAVRDIFVNSPLGATVIDPQIRQALMAHQDFTDATIQPVVAAYGGGEQDKPQYEFVTDESGERVAIDRRNPTRSVRTGIRERQRAPLVQMSNFGNASAPVPLSRTQQSAVQGDVVSGDVILSNLDSIEQSYDPQFLQVFGSRGRLAQFAARTADRSGLANLTSEQREMVGKFTKFRTQVERVFNFYRKEITGAAAALAELDRLKTALINTDQSPAEFESALSEYKSEILRLRRIRMSLLRRGITDFSEGSQGAEALDRAFVGGGDAGRADKAARLEELDAQGFSDEEIADQLSAEGF